MFAFLILLYQMFLVPLTRVVIIALKIAAFTKVDRAFDRSRIAMLVSAVVGIDLGIGLIKTGMEFSSLLRVGFEGWIPYVDLPWMLVKLGLAMACIYLATSRSALIIVATGLLISVAGTANSLWYGIFLGDDPIWELAASFIVLYGFVRLGRQERIAELETGGDIPLWQQVGVPAERQAQ